jgi:hypothetical protein
VTRNPLHCRNFVLLRGPRPYFPFYAQKKCGQLWLAGRQTRPLFLPLAKMGRSSARPQSLTHAGDAVIAKPTQ